jgi:uncharacterized membrane protein YjgN (DUF898 family)
MTERTAQGLFHGQSLKLFIVAIVYGVLSILTLGVYRFWGKTKIRKYLWNASAFDGERFEYTGTGREKFLGFLFALVVLAVYLAVVQVVLFAIGLRVVARPSSEAEVVAQKSLLYLNLLALLPLIPFARYRARRYKMARTRLRGIRFGMDDNAWKYTWRAVGLTILSIASLGVLHPYQCFSLEKFKTERSCYGDERMQQHGTWTALYRHMTHICIGIAMVVVAAVSAWLSDRGPGGTSLLSFLLGLLGILWAAAGVLAYVVKNMAYLTNNKSLGEVTLICTPKSLTILRFCLIGGLDIAVFSSVIGVISKEVLRDWMRAFDLGSGPTYIGIILVLITYLICLVIVSALVLAYITSPIIGHIIEETKLVNPDGLTAIKQRAADSGANADGFADALDFGGAF